MEAKDRSPFTTFESLASHNLRSRCGKSLAKSFRSVWHLAWGEADGFTVTRNGIHATTTGEGGWAVTSRHAGGERARIGCLSAPSAVGANGPPSAGRSAVDAGVDPCEHLSKRRNAFNRGSSSPPARPEGAPHLNRHRLTMRHPPRFAKRAKSLSQSASFFPCGSGGVSLVATHVARPGALPDPRT